MKSSVVLVVLACVLFASDIACGATLHGKVYDIGLNELSNVIVEVNSVPHQRYLSKDGNYTFDLNPGNYLLTASYSPDGVSIYNATDNVTIKSEGDYVYDIFILPDLDSEDDSVLSDQELLLSPDIEPSQAEQQSKVPLTAIVLMCIAFIVLIAASWKILKRRSKEKGKQHLPGITKKDYMAEDDYASKLLELIKKDDGRTTQKELRKQLPLSEAKISLLISELEAKGVVQKIKKGRGNIIILKK